MLIEAVTSRPPTLLAAAEHVVAATPSMGPGRYSRDQLEQLLNGFCALLREALEESGNDTYEIFMETAVPAMVADGQTTGSLVQGSAAFATLLSMHLDEAVPAEHREGARSWLSRFFGRYVADVYSAAAQAEAEGRR